MKNHCARMKSVEQKCGEMNWRKIVERGEENLSARLTMISDRSGRKGLKEHADGGK